MKKLHYFLGLLLLCNVSNAGLITHSDYTGGTAITAAGQNANENIVFNEFNGNIDNTNIKPGGIVDSNMAAHTLTGASVSLTATLQVSSITTTNFNSSSGTITNLGGITDATDTCPGCVGAYISSATNSVHPIVSPGTGQYFTIVTLSVPPGDWDLSAVDQCTTTGCTITVFQGGIGNTNGNSSVGLIPGDNNIGGPVYTATFDAGISIPNWRVNHTTTENFYIKSFLTFSGSCTASCYGRLSARRIH